MEEIASPVDSKAQPSGFRVWMPRLVSAALAPVLLLLLLEVGLRLCNIGYSTSLTVPCSLQGKPADCYNLFFLGPFFPPGMIKTPQVYAIPEEKPPNTVRIFVLGESAAMGDPDPAYGFSRYLEVMLRERYPATHFEVVNTGSVAINSHVLLPIARGLAKERPDIFILYSGNNEVVGPYGPGTALTASGMSLPIIRGSIFFHSTRVGQLLKKLGAPKREWGGMEMFLDKQLPADSPLMPYVYSNFEVNLRDTIAVAQKAGARVIVATVATNLKDCAPFASMHRPGLTAADLHSWDSLVQQGSVLENARSYGEALQRYAAAAKIDDQYAELEFRIARSLHGLGDFNAARAHFLRARDLDTLRFRADSHINDINRSVAAATGTELVDADRVFENATSDGVTGSDLVYEHVHMTPEGNYLLARSMFLQIASKLTPVMHEADVPSQVQCEQLLAFTAHDRTRLAQEMWGRLQRPPFTNQLNHSEQLLRLSLAAEGPDEAPDQTVAEYQWAIRRSPEDRILRYKFGLFLFDYNREAAAEQLRMSRPWDDFPVFTPDGNLL